MVSDILVNIDSGNGLAPVRCQAITWTNVDLYCQLNTQLQPYGKSESKYEVFHSTKFFLQYVCYFIQALVWYSPMLWFL